MTNKDKARLVFASQGFSQAGADALPEVWQDKFAALAPSDGDWYDRTVDPPAHKRPGLPDEFMAIWNEYLNSLKAAVEPIATGVPVDHGEILGVNER